MSGIERRCLDALQRAWMLGVESPRSNNKLKILHGWLRNELLRVLLGYEIFCHMENPEKYSREIRVDGKYYQKKVDLLIRRNGMDVGVVNVKFVLSNYKKNAVNYFEHQLGETANLRSQQLVYGNVIFLPDPVPVDRDQVILNMITKTERINDKSVQRYIDLSEDHHNIVVPDVQALVIAVLDPGSDFIVRMANASDLQHLTERSRHFLGERAGIEKFVRDYAMEIETSYRRRAGSSSCSTIPPSEPKDLFP